MSTPQLPLVLRAPADQRLETFVGNDIAVAALRALAQGDDTGTAYVSGAEASGKTHVLLATVAAANEAGRNAAYLPLHAMCGHLAAALDGREAAALVALDGLNAIVGEREDETALFHFHNRARAAGCSVIYAARTHPDGLGLELPDLRSRLAQGLRFTLATPDDDARCEILRRRAARRGLLLDEAALEFLLRRASRNLSELATLFERIDRESLAAQRRVTVPFLRELLSQEYQPPLP